MYAEVVEGDPRGPELLGIKELHPLARLPYVDAVMVWALGVMHIIAYNLLKRILNLGVKTDNARRRGGQQDPVNEVDKQFRWKPEVRNEVSSRTSSVHVSMTYSSSKVLNVVRETGRATMVQL